MSIKEPSKPERRNEMISLRFTREEYARIEQLAERLETPLATLVHDFCLQAVDLYLAERGNDEGQRDD